MNTCTVRRICSGLLLCSLLAPCAIGDEKEDQDSSRRILLASESTRFKNALIDKLETRFKQDGFTVVRADHSRREWNQIKASDYAAIFITNSGVNSEVRPSVLAWLEQNKGADTFILLHTTQTRDWTVQVDVDSVTSASTIRDVKHIAETYHRRITNALKHRASTASAE